MKTITILLATLLLAVSQSALAQTGQDILQKKQKTLMQELNKIEQQKKRLIGTQFGKREALYKREEQILNREMSMHFLQSQLSQLQDHQRQGAQDRVIAQERTIQRMRDQLQKEYVELDKQEDEARFRRIELQYREDEIKRQLEELQKWQEVLQRRQENMVRLKQTMLLTAQQMQEDVVINKLLVALQK